MTLLRSTRGEVKKLFRSRLFCALMLLILASPLLGSLLRYGIHAGNISSVYLLAQAKIGALAGALLLAFFTIYELDRAKRAHMLDILETVASTQTLYASKALAVAVAALFTGVVACVVYLPYSVVRLGAAFDPVLHMASYLGIMTLGMVFAVLAASGIYLVTLRLDASIILFAALAFVSMNASTNYQLNWIDTNIGVFSDYFGNTAALRVLLWNRLFGLLASSALFLLGVICTRQYGKSALYSLRTHLKKPVLLLGIVLSCVGAAAVCCFEPLFYNAKKIEVELVNNEESGTTMAVTKLERSVNDQIALLSTECDIDIDPKTASLSGEARYQIQNGSGEPQPIRFTMQPGERIESLVINGAPAEVQSLGQSSFDGEEYAVTLPEDPLIDLTIRYSGGIQESRLLQSAFGTTVISPTLVMLGGKALIPSLQVGANSPAISGEVTLPSDLMPVTAGSPSRLVSEDATQGTKTWAFSASGSSMQLLASHYEMESFRAGGMNVEFYYHTDHRQAVQALDAVDVIRDAIDFYTAMLGELGYTDVPLKIVENPSTLMGGNASGNICNIGEAIFNPEGFASVEYEGTNGAEVLAHEICHEWWGVTARFAQQMPWTPEGLTVFTTYKFLAHRYGEAYAQKTNVKNWEYAVESLKKSFYFNHPEYYQIVPAQYLFNVLSMNNGMVMYGQMAMQIYKAEQILGEEAFAKSLAKLYRRNKTDLSFQDFLNACSLTKEDISLD